MALTGEGPRERLSRLGAAALTDDEVVGLVLTGGASGRVPALRLLERVGGLAGLSRLDPSGLDEPGIGPARGASLAAAMELGRRLAHAREPARPALRDAAAAYAFLRPRLAHLPNEVFSVTLLDVRLRVQRQLIVASGSGWACAVLPRDALLPAVRDGAAAILFAHNHPSGDPAPSPEDAQLSARLIAATEILGLRPLDHLIVCREGFSSLRELGRWPSARPAPATSR